MVQGVKKEILEEAKQEAQRFIKGAKQEARAILKEAELKAKAEEERLDKELQGMLEALEKRELASGKFLARKKILVRKKAIIDSFFAHCMDAVGALPKKVREQHIRMLLSHAKKHFPVSRVYTAERDRLSLPGVKHGVSADISGGMVAENADGTRRIDYTYKTLLEHLRTHDLGEIAGTLFEK